MANPIDKTRNGGADCGALPSNRDERVQDSALAGPDGDAHAGATSRLQRLAVRVATLWQQPPRVLLAEDDEVSRMVARRLLERIGFAVDVAADGMEAVLATERTDYDVVLMDLQMPLLGGLEATDCIRSRGGRQPWIIALTASAFRSDRDLCIGAGADDYLAKPMDLDALGDALARCASGRAEFPQTEPMEATS